MRRDVSIEAQKELIQVRRFGCDEGLSMVELLVTTVIILVITAIAIPQIQRSVATYRLNSAAANVAGMLQRARFEAIKRNTMVRCRTQTVGNVTTVWVDLNNDGVPGAPEPQYVLPAEVQWVNPGGTVPADTTFNLGTTQQPAGVVTFDSRGAVNFGGGAQAVYAIYLGYLNNSTYGYKAVTIQPLGRTKIWAGSSSGTWHSP
jgi:Tfp pilus assembly protein FimT